MSRQSRRLLIVLGTAAVTLPAALLSGISTAGAASLTPSQSEVRPQIMEQAIQESNGVGPPPRAPSAAPSPRAAGPSSARPLREVFGYVNAGNLGDPTVGYPSWNFSLLSTVAYFGLSVDAGGNLIQGNTSWNVWNSTTGTGLISTAHSSGTRVVISLIQHDSGLCTALQNAQTTIQQLPAQLHGADGINVDYEGVNGACGTQTIRALTTSFMQQLRAAMPSSYLSIATYASSAGDSGGMFDIGGLAPNTDSFFVMTYDLDRSNWSHPPLSCSSYCMSPTGPLTTYFWNDTGVASQYLGVIPASKLILGIPYYGYTNCVGAAVPNAYPTATPQRGVPRYLNSVTTNGSAGVSNYSLARDVHDASGQEPYSTWDSTTYSCTRESYWDDVVSLGRKYDLVNQDNLRGAGIFTLDYGGGAPELWSSLATHFSYIPAAPTNLAVCPGDGFAEVSWSAPASNGGPLTGYTVTASPGGATASAGGKATWAPVSGLTDGTSYSFTVTASNGYGSGIPSAPSTSVTPTAISGWPGQLNPLAPTRILDSRSGLGGSNRLGPRQTIDLTVAGAGGVPASGVAAVIMNVTATNPTAYGYVTAFASGACRPFASNLNYAPGQDIPNLVEVPLGAGGKISLYNGSVGATDLIADVQGWVATSAATSGGAGRLHAMAPTRIVDTRTPKGFATLGPNQTATLSLDGIQALQGLSFEAVVANLTVTNPKAVGYITAFPAGGTRPVASNVNFAPNQTIPNRALIMVSASHQISFYNGSIGSTDLVVDLNGWYSDASGASSGGLYTGLTPVRLLDTRDGTGGVSSPIGAQTAIQLGIANHFGVPVSGATAVVLNVTATNPSGTGYVTVYPDATSPPLASDLNLAPGQTIANLVVVQLPADGTVDLYNGSTAGPVDLVVDLVGFYT